MRVRTLIRVVAYKSSIHINSTNIYLQEKILFFAAVEQNWRGMRVRRKSAFATRTLNLFAGASGEHSNCHYKAENVVVVAFYGAKSTSQSQKMK